MAKGKTNQPLQIAVAEQWVNHPAVEQLRVAGHTVRPMPASDVDVDVILHPAAHNWSEPMFFEDTKKDGTKYHPYVDAMLAAGRARKRGKK